MAERYEFPEAIGTELEVRDAIIQSQLFRRAMRAKLVWPAGDVELQETGHALAS